jgi:predicted RNA binding protein YcfA (HicA-like mRNA interferase family)
MSANLYETVVNELQASKSNLCCNDVKRLLVKLGFEVRDGKEGGHKIYTHDGLPSFYSSSFNCGHGKNPEILPTYINKIIKTLKQYQIELEEYLKQEE